MSGLRDGREAQAIATFISIPDHIPAFTPSTVEGSLVGKGQVGEEGSHELYLLRRRSRRDSSSELHWLHKHYGGLASVGFVQGKG